MTGRRLLVLASVFSSGVAFGIPGIPWWARLAIVSGAASLWAPLALDDARADDRAREQLELIHKQSDLLTRMATRWGFQKAQRVVDVEVRS